MPNVERPLLILPNPGAPVPRLRRRGFPGNLHIPSRERQRERLTPQFRRLQETFEKRLARLQTESTGIVPEEVVVLQTVGSVEGFINAVRRIEGMEWLAEIDEESIPPDDDFFAKSRDGKKASSKDLNGRLFMLIANHEALKQMFSLWEQWQSQQKLSHGLGRWKNLFSQLRNVRPWGLQDRLVETGVLQDWEEQISLHQDSVTCEIELWYRTDRQDRHRTQERVVTLIQQEGGQVITDSVVEEIRYHAIIASLPGKSVEVLVDKKQRNDIELVHCEHIQFFRATGQASVSLPDDDYMVSMEQMPYDRPHGEPLVALFDGLPLALHRCLNERIIVDDPDSYEQNYPASMRRHGTAMASLIIHGDLKENNTPLTTPIYVRPILQPIDLSQYRNESVPKDILIVDLVFRAVRRLFEQEGHELGVAPSVSVINFSIGILDRPFDYTMSPLARLIDWLAWRYKLLFIISAGNRSAPIKLPMARTEFDSMSDEDIQCEIIRSVGANAHERRLLSPAEALNALTIAATHDDASTWLPLAHSDLRNPYPKVGLPSPINAQGMGYRRAIKPDILAAGGRILVQRNYTKSNPVLLDIDNSRHAPGQCVASPGATPGILESTCFSRGTSNATAIISRTAVLLHDILKDLRREIGGHVINKISPAVWLKALVAHGADWGDSFSILKAALYNSNTSAKFSEYLTRMLGYGSVEIDTVRECKSYRVTAIGGGNLRDGESHIHNFPLPCSISGKRAFRRIVITLAWLSPVNPQHQSWRRAHLWFFLSSDQLDRIGVNRKQAGTRAAQRGTLQHEIFEGRAARTFSPDTSIETQVSCRADAGSLEAEVPYALVITMEVAEELGVDIYGEIRTAVQSAHVQVSPNP